MNRRTRVVFARQGTCRAASAPPVPKLFGTLMAGRLFAFAVSIWADRATGLPCFSGKEGRPGGRAFSRVSGINGVRRTQPPACRSFNEEFRHGGPEDPDSAQSVRSSPDRPF